MKVKRRISRKYPSQGRILNYIKRVEKLWRKDEKKVLRELPKIIHLQWRSKIIYCYVVGRCIPFSDPLTMPVYEKHQDYFVDVLIHELIHNLFIQEGNLKKSKKAWQYFSKKYKKESENTRIHIPLHAIHSHIYLKFYTEKSLKRDMKLISRLPDYKKSWQIVQKAGYKNIINEFVKRTK